jgi:hypothetical protein
LIFRWKVKKWCVESSFAEIFSARHSSIDTPLPQPNTKRRFADDDPESGDEVNHQPVYRGGGKQLIGKQLQRPPPMEDSDDDDDDSDFEQPVARGGGKHFRPGKQLRVM